MTERTDTDLVTGALAGDRDAFAGIYDRYADRLHDFCHSVLRDRDEAADAVQDTFVLAAQRLAQLNDPERLRPWLYAVARSVALRRVRDRKRVVLDEVGDMADTDPGPHRAAEQEALRELVWTAAGGLSERDRALLDLHLRHGLEGAELGEAMGVPASHAYVLLTRLRDQVERSLGALLIARLGREDCTELDALLSGWDGRFSPIMRKRVARHVDQCDVCSDRRRIMVSPWALLAGVPLLPAPLFLRDRVMANVELVSAERDLVSPTSTTPAGVVRWGSRRVRVLTAAAAVVALLAAAGSVLYWRNSSPGDGEPLALENTITGTTTATPTTGSSTPGTTTTTTGPATTTTTQGPTTRRTTTTTAPNRTTTTNVAPPPPPPPPPTTTTTTTPDTAPPVIGDPRWDPPRIFATYCENQVFTDFSVLVTDASSLSSVDMSWVGPGGQSGTRQMEFRDGRWHVLFGQFHQAGGGTYLVRAVDAHDNRGTHSGEFTVNDCQTTVG